MRFEIGLGPDAEAAFTAAPELQDAIMDALIDLIDKGVAEEQTQGRLQLGATTVRYEVNHARRLVTIVGIDRPQP